MSTSQLLDNFLSTSCQLVNKSTGQEIGGDGDIYDSVHRGKLLARGGQLLVNQSTKLLTSKLVNKSTSQLVNQSTSQSVNQSTSYVYT